MGPLDPHGPQCGAPAAPPLVGPGYRLSRSTLYLIEVLRTSLCYRLVPCPNVGQASTYRDLRLYPGACFSRTRIRRFTCNSQSPINSGPI